MVDQTAGSVNIFGYSSPAVPGVNVSYACTMPGVNFTGPRQSTCSDNGQWEPDPSSVLCLDLINSELRNRTDPELF